MENWRILYKVMLERETGWKLHVLESVFSFPVQ